LLDPRKRVRGEARKKLSGSGERFCGRVVESGCADACWWCKICRGSLAAKGGKFVGHALVGGRETCGGSGTHSNSNIKRRIKGEGTRKELSVWSKCSCWKGGNVHYKNYCLNEEFVMHKERRDRAISMRGPPPLSLRFQWKKNRKKLDRTQKDAGAELNSRGKGPRRKEFQIQLGHFANHGVGVLGGEEQTGLSARINQSILLLQGGTGARLWGLDPLPGTVEATGGKKIRKKRMWGGDAHFQKGVCCVLSERGIGKPRDHIVEKRNLRKRRKGAFAAKVRTLEHEKSAENGGKKNNAAEKGWCLLCPTRKRSRGEEGGGEDARWGWTSC